MTDIIARAEDTRARYFLPEVFRPVMDQLVAELKAARAEQYCPFCEHCED